MKIQNTEKLNKIIFEISVSEDTYYTDQTDENKDSISWPSGLNHTSEVLVSWNVLPYQSSDQ